MTLAASIAEIGPGKLPWEVFFGCSEDHREAFTACRIVTDFLISAAISNWGAYALLAGAAILKGRFEVIERINPERERNVLDRMVRKGPAVDGITPRQALSAYGIDFADYLCVIEHIREIALTWQSAGGLRLKPAHRGGRTWP